MTQKPKRKSKSSNDEKMLVGPVQKTKPGRETSTAVEKLKRQVQQEPKWDVDEKMPPGPVQKTKAMRKPSGPAEKSQEKSTQEPVWDSESSSDEKMPSAPGRDT